MDDRKTIIPPAQLAAIESDSRILGFSMDSMPKTGALLRTLVSSKPKSRILELGTGTGIGTCWIADGMDKMSTLTTIDNDISVVEVARKHLDSNPRITFLIEDGADFIQKSNNQLFDLIFADAWPGKFQYLDETLDLLAPGALYIIDDLLPQPSWPEGHAPRVPLLIEKLMKRDDLTCTSMEWSSGILIAAKHNNPLKRDR
jgi:predicted O-methyltransferase YrrM